MRAKDIMSTPVITVSPDTRLKQVAGILLDHDVSAVPVVGGAGEILGIISEADLVSLETSPDPRSRIILFRPPPRPVPRTAEEVMTREVVALPEDADVAEVARLMLEKRVKRIPIVSGDRVVGIVSRRDVLRVLVRADDEIQAEVTELLDDEILTLGRFRARVADGVVTLAGPKDRAERRLAELLARSVPGVIAVTFAD
jgi:CBS domain-containing protein